MSSEIAKQINELRHELLIHRICDFVYDHQTMSDELANYKSLQLLDLCDANPEVSTSLPYFAICPVNTVGSSNADHYPPELVKEAEMHLHDGN